MRHELVLVNYVDNTGFQISRSLYDDVSIDCYAIDFLSDFEVEFAFNIGFRN